MKHLIAGIAGHIDHGKTTLIRSLTGIDCDTHAEEKRRGITINLGFAHITLPGGENIGIIDFPGHKDFIATMVSGAFGIDIAIIVIDGNEGIMPQTREHLQIINLIGIQKTMIVISKIDLLEDAALKKTIANVKQELKTFNHDNDPIVAVSSVTGHGIGDTINILKTFVDQVETKEIGKRFRMYIDRAFNLPGVGTVVTGSVSEGQLLKEMPLYLMPSAKVVRVRGLQRYHKTVNFIQAGDRAAINVTGCELAELTSGVCLCNKNLTLTYLLDIQIILFQNSPPLKRGSVIILLSSTFKTIAKLTFLDAVNLKSGEVGYGQFHLGNACTIQSGDKVILRNSSNDYTLGGGTVTDAYPLVHKKRSQRLTDVLRTRNIENIPGLVSAELQKLRKPLSVHHFTESFNLADHTIKNNIPYLPKEICFIQSLESGYFVFNDDYNKYNELINQLITLKQKRNVLDDEGITFKEICLGIQESYPPTDDIFVKLLLEDLYRKGKIQRAKEKWTLYANTNKNDESHLIVQINAIEAIIKNAGLEIQNKNIFHEHINKAGIQESIAHQIVNSLKKNKLVVQLEDALVHQTTLEWCRNILINYLKKNASGIAVSTFRDLTSSNRKISLLLLAYFEKEKLLFREGDKRVLMFDYNG